MNRAARKIEFPEHLSLRDCLSKETELMREDTKGLLGPKITNLAMHFTLLEQAGIDPHIVPLIEVGANLIGNVHMKTSESTCYRDANIGHYLIRHNDKYLYKAFDPKNDNVALHYSWFLGRRKQLRRYTSRPIDFIHDMELASLKTYEDFQEHLRFMRAEEGIPVVFSSHTLSFPDINKKWPFWKERALHSHILNTEDLEFMYKVYLSSTLPRDFTSLDPLTPLWNEKTKNLEPAQLYEQMIREIFDMDKRLDIHVFTKFPNQEALCTWYAK